MLAGNRLILGRKTAIACVQAASNEAVCIQWGRFPVSHRAAARLKRSESTCRFASDALRRNNVDRPSPRFGLVLCGSTGRRRMTCDDTLARSAARVRGGACDIVLRSLARRVGVFGARSATREWPRGTGVLPGDAFTDPEVGSRIDCSLRAESRRARNLPDNYIQNIGRLSRAD